MKGMTLYHYEKAQIAQVKQGIDAPDYIITRHVIDRPCLIWIEGLVLFMFKPMTRTESESPVKFKSAPFKALELISGVVFRSEDNLLTLRQTACAHHEGAIDGVAEELQRVALARGGALDNDQARVQARALARQKFPIELMASVVHKFVAHFEHNYHSIKASQAKARLEEQ